MRVLVIGQHRYIRVGSIDVPEVSNTAKKVWYHGRQFDSTVFSLEFIGKQEALDQDGPGFYFTNTLSDAEKYALPNGVVLECQIKYAKSRLLPTKGKPSESLIRRLIHKSPDRDDTLTNFAENPVQAKEEAVKVYIKNDNPVDAYQTIWHDFYDTHSADYLKVLWFYHGHMVPREMGGIKHLVIYKPDIIKVLRKIPVKELE